jgi:transcriptional regulator with XRE-family HTH domain
LDVPADAVYGSMANERLRAALLQHGLTPYALAEKLGVDHKTVERWIGGRTPYRRHRYAIATELGVDEVYLWPDALPRDQVAIASESEIIAVYPHRTEVPRDGWERLFASAEQDIGVLVYSGLFLAEDQGVQRTLAEKAQAGVRVRFLLGNPDSPQVAQRSTDEGLEGMMAMKIREALRHYRSLRAVEGVEVRFHQTVLYNSIYRADGQLLVNTHVYGCPAAHAPVWHLKKVPGGEIASIYLESFEHVWDSATPAPEA